MSIGIHDADYFKYAPMIFNLESMKLAAYYKQKNEIVRFSPTVQPEKYGKFFYRKDYDDDDYPIELHNKNVEYGGFAFTNGIYVPLKKEIEQTIPDTSIYLPYNQKFNGFGKKRTFKNLINAVHIRLSLDGKTIWEDYAKQIKKSPRKTMLIIHDYNVNQIYGAREEVNRILSDFIYSESSPSIGFKFPLTFYKGEDFVKWSPGFYTSNFFFNVDFSGVIDDKSLSILINESPRALEKTNFYVTDGLSSENDFLKNALPKILRQVIFCREHGVEILLKYDEDFFIMDECMGTLDLLNKFMKIRKEENLKSIVDYAKTSSMKERRWVRNIFRFLRSYSPEVFKMLYECDKVRLVNGRFQ